MITKGVAVVTGTRRDTRRGAVSAWLDAFAPGQVVLGCCNVRLEGYKVSAPLGVDAEAHAWCLSNGSFPIICQAPWDAVGLCAGPERNTVIALVARGLEAHLRLGSIRCGAFPDKKSRGTWDAKAKLERLGFTVETPGWP